MFLGETTPAGPRPAAPRASADGGSPDTDSDGISSSEGDPAPRPNLRPAAAAPPAAARPATAAEAEGPGRSPWPSRRRPGGGAQVTPAAFARRRQALVAALFEE